MKVHTNDYKDKIKEFGKQITSKITYQENGNTIELGEEELNSITPHYEASILKSVMKQLDIDSNVDIPLETILNYQFGLFVDRYTETTDETYQADIDYYVLEDDEYVLLIVGIDYNVGDNITGTIYNYQDYEYLNFGNYVVYSSEKQEDTNSYNIICYDKMLYSMTDYNNDEIQYPITIRDYIYAICNKIGLTFKNSGDEFANYDKEIQSELYLDSGGNSLNYKFRDVLDELAQATASTICINEDDDELEIRYITDTNDTIDEEFLKDINVNFGELNGPYNTIVLSRSADSDKLYKSYPDDLPEEDRVAIEIKDNQIMNWEDREDYLPDILNKLNGLQYYINDYSSPGITYYNLCDRYNISIGETTYSCIMFNNELNITQGLEELVHTDKLEEAEPDYSKADKTDRRINQTYLIVDKQKGEIEALTSRTSTLEDDMGNVYTKTETNQLIQNAETGLTNTFSEAGGNNILRNTRFSAQEVLETGQIYEYWFGNVKRTENEDSANGYSILLQNDTLYQTQRVANGNYTLSFKYKLLNSLATCKVVINGSEYNLTNEYDTLFQTGVDEIPPIGVNSNEITIAFVSDIDDACEVYDIMLNAGNTRLAYSQNQNETITTNVNISKGITITVEDEEVKFVANNTGIKTVNTTTNDPITTFTATGMETNNAEITDTAKIIGIYRQKVGNQIWDSII